MLTDETQLFPFSSPNRQDMLEPILTYPHADPTQSVVDNYQYHELPICILP